MKQVNKTWLLTNLILRGFFFNLIASKQHADNVFISSFIDRHNSINREITTGLIKTDSRIKFLVELGHYLFGYTHGYGITLKQNIHLFLHFLWFLDLSFPYLCYHSFYHSFTESQLGIVSIIGMLICCWESLSIIKRGLCMVEFRRR